MSIVSAHIDRYSVEEDIVYYIVTVRLEDNCEYVVKKRYQDFDDLHKALEWEFLELPIPKIPPKKWKYLVDHASSSFITQRQFALDEFISFLADPENPFISKSLSLIAFLQPQV